jgi:hypothetical protein
MRVESKIPVGGTAPSARRPGGKAFSLDGAGAGRGTAAASAPVDLGGIDALLLLQGEDSLGERRKRQARRGRDLLDALDKLKAAFLTGRVQPSDLKKLRSTLALRREETGDSGLDEVLAHIELRAEVELAKLQR